MSDLLPCPFCGGKAKYYYYTYSDGEKDEGVKCTECEICTGTYETPGQARRYWNKRIGKEANVIKITEVKEIHSKRFNPVTISNEYHYECESCHIKLKGDEKFCPQCGVRLIWE